MKRDLRAISIDGTRGSGKTSQIGILRNYFKLSGLSPKIFKLGQGLSVDIETLKTASSFLSEDSKNIAIFDGSISRQIATEIVTGAHMGKILDKFKSLIEAYERLEHQFGLFSLIILMDDIVEASSRIERNAKLLGKDVEAIKDPHLESEIIKCMKNFNTHIVSKNLLFNTIIVNPLHPMLEVNKDILVKMRDLFEFPEPKKDRNDW